MNLNEFHEQLAAAPAFFRRNLRNYLRHPTERNTCYITGYVAALEDTRLFKTTPPPVIGWPSLAALGARALWVAN